jgi:signal peptidase I
MNLGPFTLRRVIGNSMEPFIYDGDYAIFIKLRTPRIGDIVIFFIDNIEYCKRIEKIENDCFWAKGDNFLNSLDSRRFGWVKLNRISYKFLIKV